jgi:tetratricopeptide (TPR) repeat protein
VSRMLRRLGAACTGMVIVAMTVGGCAGGGSGNGPYQSQAESLRNSDKAVRLTQEAVKLMDSNPQKAESLLREALTSDLYHGPAHNNLGVLHLKHEPRRLYEAASEFEWARKLMPGHPDPRVNLAMTLEEAGRTDDALDTYETAMEVYPNYLPAVQGIASLQLRTGKADERTQRYLSDIASRAEDPTWREWARKQLLEFKPAGAP